MPPSMLSGSGRAYLIAFCSLLSVAAGAVAGVVPSPWSWAIAALALLAGGVAGLASKVPAILEGKPYVSPAVAVAFLTISGVLVEQASTAPEGLYRAALLAVAVVFAGLAGKPLPGPGATQAGKALPLLLVVFAVGAQGCASPAATPHALGPSPFTFKAEPSIPIEKCLELAERQSKAESYSEGLTWASGAGGVVTGFLAIFVAPKVATATSALVSTGAAGGALFAGHRASELDELLALYGCPRLSLDEASGMAQRR